PPRATPGLGNPASPQTSFLTGDGHREGGARRKRRRAPCGAPGKIAPLLAALKIFFEHQLARLAGGSDTAKIIRYGLRSTINVLQPALEAAGIEFTDGDQPGARLTKAAAARSAEPASASKPTVAAKVVRGKTAKATGKKR